VSTIVLVHRAKGILDEINYQMQECYSNGIDYSYLIIARDAITCYLTTVEQSLGHKIDLYSYYGEPLDSEELRQLIDEIGYDQAKLLYGDELDEALQGAVE
jgi:hypothetical protein